MSHRYILGSSLALAATIWAFGAHAETITYSDFDHLGTNPIDYIVTVDDDAANLFTITFDVATKSPNTTNKFTGIYLDFTARNSSINSPYNLGNLGLIAGNPSGGPTDIAFNSVSIDGVTNLNKGEFDVVFGFKKPNFDLGNDGPGTFQIARNGLTLADVQAIGMRGQDTNGPGVSGGSSKEVQDAPNAVVPLPAAAWLFGSALLGMAGIGYKRRE